jgi:carboxyl-terminal processing protease
MYSSYLRFVTPSVLLVAFGAIILGCATTGVGAEEALTPEQAALNLESFDYVWTTMRDRNWDPELGGLDWDAVRDEVRPQVEQAETMEDARAAMSEMLKRIDQTHLSIIPASVYEEIGVDSEESPAVSAPVGTTGLTVRVIDDRLLVTDVAIGSPAADSNVQPGWEILAINKDRVDPTIRKVEESLGDSTMRQIMLARAFTERLDGPINEPVYVKFRGSDGKRFNMALARVVPAGENVVFGNLPVGPVWLEHKTIDDDIGYIAFNVFMDPVNLMPAFEEAMRSYSDRRGIVVDLRGNRGGIAAMAMGLAGWFVNDANAYLGTMYMRNAELRMVVNPRPNSYDGPVAILVDGCSASCAEIFAGGLRDLGRARIFGSTTAGAALPAAVEKLPNGDGFMYPVANYISRNGDRFEGVGVVPDVEAGYVREALLAGRDVALEAAAAWIRGANGTVEAGGD